MNLVNKQKLIVILAGIAVIALLSCVFILQPQSFKKIQYSLYDSLLSKLKQSEPSGLVIIVDIDEKSLAEFGQWPWPRYKIANLLAKLQQMQVLSVGVDFLFSEPDRSSLSNVIKNFQSNHLQTNLFQSLGLNTLALNTLTELSTNDSLDNDLQMSKVLASGPYVLAYSFLFEKNQALSPYISKNPTIHPLNMMFLSTEEATALGETTGQNLTTQDIVWYQAKEIINNLEIFSQEVAMSGFMNISPEHDGVIRKVPLIIQYQDKLYPSLALATLMTAIQAQQVVLKKSNHGIDTLIVDEQQIPLDKQGNIWIHFRDSPKSVFQTISAADILNNKIPMPQIANHIILLGTSAKGLLDLRSTPYNTIFPGVEVHASIIDNIIRSDFINHPPWAKSAELVLIIVVGFISLAIVLWARATFSFILNLLLISLLLYASWWWLENDRFYLSVFYPILIILLNFSILSVLQYRFKEKKLILETLEHNKIQKIALTQLQQAKNELEIFSNSLELQVKERTKELAEINQHTRESIEYASLIQSAILPDNTIFNSYFQESFALWNPKDIVGGDIYLMEALNIDELLIMVIDCTGHGVPGAFVTMLVKAIERQIIANLYQGANISPAKILSIFNQSIKHLLKQESSDSVSNAGFDGAILHYNKNEKLFRYAGANTPLFVMQNDQLKIIKGDRYSIGYNSCDADYEFTNHEISLKNGGMIYLSTDGYLDQTGGDKGFPFGKNRFKRLLQQLTEINMSAQKEIFIQQLKQYQDTRERVDDVTLIGIKV